MATLPVLMAAALILVPGVRTQCSQFCTCVGTLADCSARAALSFRFTDIPLDLPPDTTELILTGNSISTLSSGAFSHLPALRVLQLRQNHFSSVPASGLGSLEQLERLILDGNPLGEVGEGTLSNLASLQELSIKSTPLTSLSSGSFLGLSSLTTLLLDDNEIVSLPISFLEHLPSLEQLSLTGNRLDTLPDGFFADAASSVQVDLRDNPWSCDCRLAWLPVLLATSPALLSPSDATCLWPPHLIGTAISSLATTDFTCYTPLVTQGPHNDSVLTESAYTLAASIDGAPFPTVVWSRDREPITYTERVYVAGYDASLQFSPLANGDGGVYDISLSNDYGGVVTSSPATLTVTEVTCVDRQFTASHETDVDCGGDLCPPCASGQRCEGDSDCEEGLVCLFPHSLPSDLHYITTDNPAAFTCANSSVPEELLQSFLSKSVLEGSLVVNGNSTKQEVEDVWSRFIAEMLSIPHSSLGSVSVSSVERSIRPLYLLQFEVRGSCEDALSSLHALIDSGILKMTAKISGGSRNSCYHIRLSV